MTTHKSGVKGTGNDPDLDECDAYYNNNSGVEVHIVVVRAGESFDSAFD